MKNKIVIISGDPNSVNSEIIYKSWKKLPNSTKKKIFVISNYSLLKKQLKIFNYKIQLKKVENINASSNKNELKIINIDLDFSNPLKVPINASAQFFLKSLNYAHKLAIKKKIKSFINCPINKQLLNKTGMNGVTEYLASKCKIPNNTEVMLIRNEKLSVSPLTTHIKIKEVSKAINKKYIFNKIKSLHINYKKVFKKKPKIGILGLNPHNDEFKKNSEEVRIIEPVILKLKKIGLNLKGPLVSDTVFIDEYKNYDVIVGAYHDQVLSPFKAIFKFDAINITLGLSYVRLSPDHGTAFNLIGKNKANPKSLIKCIQFVNKYR